MQRETEQAVHPSLAPDDRASALRQKSMLLQARVKGAVALQRRPDKQQRRSQQLQHRPKELQADHHEARPQQVRHLQPLNLAHLWGGAARWAVGNEYHSEKPILRKAARYPGGRQKHKEPLREERSRREVPSRQQTWHIDSLKKATGSERRGAARAQCLSPPEKSKGKWAPSHQTSGGRQLVESRVGRRTDLEKLNPLLATAGETKFLEGKEERVPKGMWHLGKGLRNNTEDQSPEGKLEDLEQLWLVSSTHKKGAMPLVSPHQCGDKDDWQKGLESVLEELFNTSRKLKEHLTWQLEQRSLVDQNPAGEQVFSESQEPSSDTPGEEGTGHSGTAPAAEVESPWTASQYSLLQLPSQAESAKDHHLAPPTPKSESQTLPPEDGVSVSREDSILQSPKPSPEPPKPATLVEGLPLPYPQEQPDQADCRTSRQEKKTGVEGRRQKRLLEQTEHPNMSLEIHYKAELEEERRARRRTRLALLKSYPTGVPTRKPGPVPRTHSPLCSSSIDEEKHNEMVRDFQRRILEQNKLHEQFLQKARKRLQEFQKAW
ncbi:PREDICTED: protein DDC8 homolog isoform X2 [Chinchilla lanigera]|nr:PREDICTED: protein DDC8 homolog isoform X2 [Chinchilla lanigera]XP_013361560.1 PREDICTED: protein DDC8 homolog isoform X2 [Chinchilla lanigera]XP_013361561.1 PREDICTED: protein DDC8 homolog isoform X2 [Chinchilla lanigera]XP_013361562.1 PREDICTED: protein DDC8 homolog isoform X2 [Chinchilla lanigera]XP_013361563.1 PREDICTED: protein DDC8 homolog isoform X2 [Chinchilla lanigera]